MSLRYSALHMVQILQPQEGMAGEPLQNALAGHERLDRWNCFDTVEATIINGGQLFGMKGTPQYPTSSSDHRTVPLN